MKVRLNSVPPDAPPRFALLTALAGLAIWYYISFILTVSF